MTIETSLTMEEIRSYYRRAAIAGAEHRAVVSLWFGDLGDTRGREVIVEVFDRHGSDWDWRCT
ncbi:hypothetical protein AB0K60_10970 [Thermopolyspora sp. NPDC052614]|uniref:hypothetical protein n=1 Tax=Thermopolyspora sp. NPDC052614 TaxID=3155682 RepID=UPI003442B19D